MSIMVPAEQCSCSCCIGFYCNPIQMTDFLIPSCADDDAACVTVCKMMYPADCNDINSQTFAICLSGVSKITGLNIYGLVFVILYYFIRLL